MIADPQLAPAVEEWPAQLPLGTQTVPISRIIIGKRHRKEFGNLQSLANSIIEEGLLQPIGITHEWQLVFGERRLRAIRDVLGMKTIEARVVDVPSIVAGEYAENEMRLDFTPSERVAIAEAMRAELAGRHGGHRTVSKIGTRELDALFPIEVQEPEPGEQGGPQSTLPTGKSRDLAAQRAGFDSGRQLDRASNVVRLGVPALVEAMDKGEVSITAAAEIAKVAPSEQAHIVALPEPERIEELRRRKDEAARLRAAADEQEKKTGPTAFTGFVRKNGRLPDKAEAENIATLDHRETPVEGGKRVKPACAKTTKEEREDKKRIEGYQDEIWRTQQACQLLAMNTTDPAILMNHIHYLDHRILEENLLHARKWLVDFAKELPHHAK